MRQEIVAAAPALAPWLEIPSCHHDPVRVRWAGDRCSVCDSDIDFDSDQLVSCDKCNITVHQSCYGVPELPGVQWRSRCPLPYGRTQRAFIPTTVSIASQAGSSHSELSLLVIQRFRSRFCSHIHTTDGLLIVESLQYIRIGQRSNSERWQWPRHAGSGDFWMCRACELEEVGVLPPQCCLCPVVGGALKPTTLPGLWAHAACMQWIPEAPPPPSHLPEGRAEPPLLGRRVCSFLSCSSPHAGCGFQSRLRSIAA